MRGIFDVYNLQRLLKDFYTAIGIRISIFDDEFNVVTEYPPRAPAFCTLVRRTEEGREGCKQCDKMACERAKLLKRPHIYTCHAGITEAVAPIVLSGNVLGYALLAHMIPEENATGAVQKACKLVKKYGIAEEESLAAIREITTKSYDQIEAAVKLLDAIASYVYIRNLVQWKNEDASDSIEQYIHRNLEQELTSEHICRRFHCSRSYLYQFSLKQFGMGIMQYVNVCRIERAQKLLDEGYSLAETAERCGFSDYNYFCKVFRKKVGTSPMKYKKTRHNN